MKEYKLCFRAGGKEQVREVLTCPRPCRNRYFARIRAWESCTWLVKQCLSFWKMTMDLFCRTLLSAGWILCSNHASAKGTFCFIWNLLHQICHMSPDWKLCLFSLHLPQLRTPACLALYPKEPQRAVQLGFLVLLKAVSWCCAHLIKLCR